MNIALVLETDGDSSGKGKKVALGGSGRKDEDKAAFLQRTAKEREERRVRWAKGEQSAQ